MSTNLILASASPRRRELLAVFDIDFEVEPADVDESVLHGEPPEDYVIRVAVAKARAVAAGHWQHRYVLGSDTVVVVDDEILGKPSDAGQAARMLSRLSGRTHRVLSAVALVAPDAGVAVRLSETRVEFATLPEGWIGDYIASGRPMDKAGAYGIQDVAGTWVRRIDGSYTGVVGLPLYETGELLRQAGLA